MEIDSARAQEPFECFGIPLATSREAELAPTPVPPGWNRRSWFLHEGALLGIEALPSSPVAAAVEVDRVR
ncbi:MAG TPA: hypothetical protein VN782_14155 [Usitatibacter sp.]|nr:hypothetical protein [Usitatibacter sp.]